VGGPRNEHSSGMSGTCSTMNMRLSAAEGGYAVLHLGGEKCGKGLIHRGMGTAKEGLEHVVQ
jgi:hypothetical protein